MTIHQAIMGIAGGRDATALDRDHITRLLQLQQLTKKDIIRQAADFQSTQSADIHKSLEYSKNVTLEQQLMEAQFLCSGLQSFQGARSEDLKQELNMIDQTHANAAITHRFLARAKNLGGQASPAQQAGMTQQSKSPSKPKPLQYFNNGIKVDMDGDPIHANKKINIPAPVQGNANKVPFHSINSWPR